MQIIDTPVGAVTPYGKNAKRHDKRQIDNAAESIRQYGMTNVAAEILRAEDALRRTESPCLRRDYGKYLQKLRRRQLAERKGRK